MRLGVLSVPVDATGTRLSGRDLAALTLSFETGIVRSFAKGADLSPSGSGMDSGATVTSIGLVCLAYEEARGYDRCASDMPPFEAVREPV
jgi:hypothetical protein